MEIWKKTTFDDYLQDIFNDPYATLGSSLLIASVLAIGTPVSPFAGILGDYVPRKWIVLVASFCTSIILFINFLITIFSGPLWAVYAVCVFLGVGVGIFYATDWALGIDAIPNKESIAKDMGIWHVADTVPSMIAPLITGVIVSSGTFQVGQRYAWSIAFALSTCWVMLSGVAALFICLKKKTPGDVQTVEMVTDEKKEGESIIC